MVPAPTARPNIAPGLTIRGLQPIMLKRQQPNPSRRVKNFRQGWPPFWTSVLRMLGETRPKAAPNHTLGTTRNLLAPPIRPEPVQNLPANI